MPLLRGSQVIVAAASFENAARDLACTVGLGLRVWGLGWGTPLEDASASDLS